MAVEIERKLKKHGFLVARKAGYEAYNKRRRIKYCLDCNMSNVKLQRLFECRIITVFDKATKR